MKKHFVVKAAVISLSIGVLAFLLLPVRYATFGPASDCGNEPNVECGAGDVHEKNRPFLFKLLDSESPAYVLDFQTTGAVHSGVDYIRGDLVRNGFIAGAVSFLSFVVPLLLKRRANS